MRPVPREVRDACWEVRMPDSARCLTAHGSLMRLHQQNVDADSRCRIGFQQTLTQRVAATSK